MEISVIVVSWNASRFLRRCLESVRAELARCPDLDSELIVVDNASSDGSADIAAREYPEAILVRNDRNTGFARANNIGILKSSGKYLCLVDAQTALKEGCLRSLHRYLEAYPEIGMIGPRIVDSRGNVQRSCRGFPTFWNMLCRAMALDTLFPRSRLFGGYLMPYWECDSVRTVEVLNGCLRVVRRRALEDVGLLDEDFFMYGDDMDWSRRFRDAGWPVVFYPGALALHQGGSDDRRAPVRFYIEQQKAGLLYRRKHHGPLGEATMLVTMILHESLRYAGNSVLSRYRGAGRRADAEKSRAALRWLIGLGSQMFRPEYLRSAPGGKGAA